MPARVQSISQAMQELKPILPHYLDVTVASTIETVDAATSCLIVCCTVALELLWRTGVQKCWKSQNTGVYV